MPPRIPAASVPGAASSLAELSTTRAAPFARSFSSTPCRERISKNRLRMSFWLNSRDGRALADNAGRPSYLGPFEDQPFPLNPLFRSQTVLDDRTKELIWDKVTQRGEPLKAVSAEMGVDVRRVAAVVRLKTMEKQWKEDGKKLATPYARAVMGMLPKTSFVEGEKNQAPHEPINEVMVHRKTTQQLFVPVSESREFTRKDAADSFEEGLRTVDQRSLHREMIAMEKRVLKGTSRKDSMEAFVQATQEEEDALAQRLQKERELEEKRTKRHKTDRFEFRIKDFDAELVGKDGKSVRGTGWRYGVPFEDRKRGAVKIPTSVP